MTPLPTFLTAWNILTWGNLPPCPPSPSSAPAPSSPGSFRTLSKGRAAAPTHGERLLGSISRGTQLPGVIFHQCVGSEP